MIQMGLVKAKTRHAADPAGDALRSSVDRHVDEALQRIGVARTEDGESLMRRQDLLEKRANS